MVHIYFDFTCSSSITISQIYLLSSIPGLGNYKPVNVYQSSSTWLYYTAASKLSGNITKNNMCFMVIRNSNNFSLTWSCWNGLSYDAFAITNGQRYIYETYYMPATS